MTTLISLNIIGIITTICFCIGIILSIFQKQVDKLYFNIMEIFYESKTNIKTEDCLNFINQKQ